MGYLNLWDVFLENLELPFFTKLWWWKKISFLQMHDTILQKVK